MQQITSRQLYAYWDRVRNGRNAPRRFEIEPGHIAPLLPETFIAESTGLPGCRFRLVGTKICQQFSKELRGTDLLSLFGPEDQDALASLLRTVFSKAAVGEVRFNAHTKTNRQVPFELVLMPLIHTGNTINRLLGAITAVENPFWLGATPLHRQEIVELNLHWPEEAQACAKRAHEVAPSTTEIVQIARRRFRVYEGGR
jgi:hypothetical protein